MPLDGWSPNVKDILEWANSGTVASTRAIVAVLTEKFQCRAFEQFMTALAVKEERLLREFSEVYSKCGTLLVRCLWLLTYSERDPHISTLLFHLFRDGDIPVQFLNECIVPPSSFEDCYRTVCISKGSSISCNCRPCSTLDPFLASFVLSVDPLDEEKGCHCRYSNPHP